MGKRGSSSGMGGGSRIANDFQSAFGFENVGVREEFKSMTGFSTSGTVVPTVDDVQRYFDSGKFDNYGTSAAAKKAIAQQISRDMNGRGFEMQVSEDGVHLLPDGDTSKAITLGRQKDKWKAKVSSSSGTTSRSGMRGALDKASRK